AQDTAVLAVRQGDQRPLDDFPAPGRLETPRQRGPRLLRPVRSQGGWGRSQRPRQGTARAGAIAVGRDAETAPGDQCRFGEEVERLPEALAVVRKSSRADVGPIRLSGTTHGVTQFGIASDEFRLK